jgi:TonB-linked SusC/RagA family outer membrane protein
MTSNLCINRLILALTLCGGLPFTSKAELNYSDKAIVQQSTIKVKGIVVDEQGESIIGATVIQQGTKNGTITDLDGKFVLDVPEGSHLVVSFIGYTNSIVSAKPSMTITLHSNISDLNEVVVVGYGIQKKVDVVGSISTVNSKQLESRGVSNVSNMLTGHLSGVTITQRSGNPGKDEASIRVRGVGSFGATPEPLILIDGLPGSWSDLTPSDIENISVLKDASSAAIYGSRAANGVILVTTKGGKDGRTRVSYNGSMGLSKAFSLPEFAHSYEYATYYNMAIGKNTYTDEMIQKLRMVAIQTIMPMKTIWKNYWVAQPFKRNMNSMSVEEMAECSIWPHWDI